MGTACISIAISHFEDTYRQNLARLEFKRDWYQLLYNRLGASRKDIEKSCLNIITFNYDRSLEAYLEAAFMVDFSTSREEARDAMKAIKIVHIYGANGPQALGDKPSDFGPSESDILIMPEARSDQENVLEAQEIIRTSRLICFLGFGYDPENVTRLNAFNSWPEGSKQHLYGMPPPPQKRSFGTTMGKTPAELKDIASHFKIPFDKNKGGPEMDCLELIRHTGVLNDLTVPINRH